ncbi:MAG: hypothetical protein JNM30_07895 [Rhodospirillales bacterium]|nr:hypothetical protein [Rhodospirillales bacterium]
MVSAVISFNTIQSPFPGPAGATDEARIAAILAILEKDNAKLPYAAPPAIDQVPSQQSTNSRVYRSWRDAADSVLAALEQEGELTTPLPGGSPLDTFDQVPSWLERDDFGAEFIPVGGRGIPPRPRRMTTRGELEWLTYTDLMKKLAELNPHHPLVSSPFARRNSVPDYRELKELRDIVEQEIMRTRSTMPIPRLERHHMLPKQHRGLMPLDVDIESREYTAWLLREVHRLAPKGLHTGPDNWNKELARRLYQHAELNKEKIDREVREVVLAFLARYSADD